MSPRSRKHTVKATTAHEVPERKPIEVRPGEVVEVGRRDTTWPAFVYVTASSGEGWVPARHLDIEGSRGVVIESYDTTELATSVGEILEVVERDEESGWLWCRNRAGREGWVSLVHCRPSRVPLAASASLRHPRRLHGSGSFPGTAETSPTPATVGLGHRAVVPSRAAGALR